MDFSVVIPVHGFRNQLLETLTQLHQCQPPASEILIHIDSSDSGLADRIRSDFPAVTISQSKERLGPGGSRNLLIKASANEWVVSLDDDSHPVDDDFFARLHGIVMMHPNAAVISCNIIEPGGTHSSESASNRRVADYVGCGCVHRREAFLSTSGYVPLPLAYGMEEVDHALRLSDSGDEIIFCPSLRILHNTDPSKRTAPPAIAASIANVFLRAWLRYPWFLLPLGILQALHRACWLMFHGQVSGIVESLRITPKLLSEHGWRRHPVSVGSVLGYHLRRRAHA